MVFNKTHIDIIITIIFFILNGAILTLLMFVPFTTAQMTILLLAGILKISYSKDWHYLGTIILYLLLGIGTFASIFLFYITISLGTIYPIVEYNIAQIQKCDLLFGSLVGLFGSILILVVFYKLKTTDTKKIEDIFSFFLFIAMIITMVISLFQN